MILSDRGLDAHHLAIPSLLAVSALEQHLIRIKKRTAVSVILESGEPRDVHQLALLEMCIRDSCSPDALVATYVIIFGSQCPVKKRLASVALILSAPAPFH